MYIIILLWLFIFILIALLLKQLNVKKNYTICFFITLTIILFILNMNDCIAAAIDGCKLVLRAIIPTILPFSVICNLLICYDGINLYSKIIGPFFCKPLGLSKHCSFPLAASFLCGYPLGAKYSCDVYKDEYINFIEFKNLCNIASNVGPIFLLGAVGSAMLHSTYYGYILLIANYLSIIIIGLALRKKNHKCITKPQVSLSNKIIFGNAMKTSIEGAISTTLNVSVYVIIFSVIISIVKSNDYFTILISDVENFFNIPKNLLYGLALGSIEMTNGCKIISELSLSTTLKLSMISGLCSFSGLSIISQVSSFFSEHNLPMKRYIIIKFIQGILSFIITYISATLLLPSSVTTYNNISQLSVYHFYYFLIPIFAFLIITLFYSIAKYNISIKKSSR